MHTLPAATGWSWFKQGFALFRRQPAELSTLFLTYLFLMLAIGFLPLLGQILPLVLVPIFSIAFMQACVQIERGKRVYPNLLLTGFRSPARGRLLILGVLYLLAVLLAVLASALVDDSAFLRMMTTPGGADAAELARTSWARGMLVAGIVYLPAAMCFWFAAPLIAWKGMGVGKAIFYSFFAVLRSGRAFLVYGLAWLITGVIVPSVLNALLVVLFHSKLLSLVVLLPVSLMLTAVLYYSFYPTYVTIFGDPAPPSPSPLNHPDATSGQDTDKRGSDSDP